MTSTAHTTGRAGHAWRDFLRRGGLVLVVFVIVGSLGGLVAAELTQKQYTGVARVLVSDTGVGTITTVANGRTSGEVNLDTETQLVTSNGVIRAARRADHELHRFSLDQLTSQIAVSVPANTAVLQIAYTDTTPVAAMNGANAIAGAYLSNRRSAAQRQLTAQINQATTTRDNLTTQLKAQTAALHQGAGPRPNNPSLQITLLKSHIQSLNTELVALHNIQVTPGQVVSRAVLPTSPSSPSRILYVGSGFAVGLLLGLIGAWLRTRFRRTIRSADDLARAVDAPCVAVLRTAEPNGVGAVGTYRHLSLVATSVLSEPARIVITSPITSPVCNLVASGMASSLAQTGTPTALLQVHGGPHIEAPGSTSAVSVTRYESCDEIAQPGDRSLSTALDRIRGDRGLLIIGVPGATVTADAQVLAAEADAALIVVPSGTRSRTVRETLAGLDSVGAPILGTVLVPGSGLPTRRRPTSAYPKAGSVADHEAGSKRTAPRPNGRPADDAIPRGDLSAHPRRD